MKKILSVLMLCLMLLFSGCSKKETADELTRVTTYLSELKSYSLTSTMTIHRSDKNVSIRVGVDYLSPSYYKVSFTSQDNNEQLIIKNDNGVYVLTPSLNKQFKFDSDWPLNSSHAYLLEAICKDIKADQAASGTQENSNIKIECAITHKTNQNATKMQYLCKADDLKPQKTLFLNDKGDPVIEVDFDSFTPNNSLSKDHFNEKKYLTEQEDSTGKDEETADIAVTAGYEIEGNQLESSTTKDNVTILCYSGSKPYTIIVQEAQTYSEVIPLECYQSIDFLEGGLCFFNENTMKYFLGNYEIAIYSNSLTTEEYLDVAGAITLV